MLEKSNIQNNKSQDDVNKIEDGNIVKEESTTPQITAGSDVEKQTAEADTSTLSQPSIMEVHKHSHHVTHKKSWKEYLLEFFMIFLAVFLGFFAENIREHYVEQQRAKEYAQSLYNDLKIDSYNLDNTVGFNKWRNAKLDSLILMMGLSDHQKIAKELYYYSCFSTMVDFTFKPSDITIQQLRSSGSLRYFKNVELYNTITKYYMVCNFYSERENDNRQFIPPVTLISKIFNADLLMTMTDNVAPPDPRDAIHWPPKNQEFRLLTSDGQEWNEFSLLVRKQRQRSAAPLMLLNGVVKNNLNELMALLRKEYHTE